MDTSNQANEKDRPLLKDNQNRTAQPGAAWVDKPVKVDGLTDAEEFTKEQVSYGNE